jgi:hypothetical protein
MVIFFLFLTLGFKLRASYLLGRCSSVWVIPPAFCVLVTFEIRSRFLLRLAWIPTMLPIITGMYRCISPRPVFSLRWGSTNFFLPQCQRGNSLYPPLLPLIPTPRQDVFYLSVLCFWIIWLFALNFNWYIKLYILWSTICVLKHVYIVPCLN